MVHYSVCHKYQLLAASPACILPLTQHAVTDRALFILRYQGLCTLHACGRQVLVHVAEPNA